jgi:hypothetical protein
MLNAGSNSSSKVKCVVIGDILIVVIQKREGGPNVLTLAKGAVEVLPIGGGGTQGGHVRILGTESVHILGTESDHILGTGSDHILGTGGDHDQDPGVARDHGLIPRQGRGHVHFVKVGETLKIGNDHVPNARAGDQFLRKTLIRCHL